MASRSRLYTHFNPPRTHQTENTNEMINVVILDIDENHFMMMNPNIQLKRFTKDEIDECINYITSDVTNLYLFLSSDVGNTFIPLIYNYLQIKSVYILNKYENYQNYSYAARKIRDIFHDINEMVKQFQDDITKLKNQYYSEQSTFQNINPESGEVLWWKFFDKMLQHIQHTNIAKDEFTAFSRQVYQDKERALKEIEEFESTYTPDKAIYWYTRETFLYRFVNQTLRTQKNLNNIFKLRLFLTNLVSALKSVQVNMHHINTHYPLTLYRGMQTTTEEIKQLTSAVGNSILFNQLLSTSMNYDVARCFLGCSYADSSIQSALVTMKIDSANMNSGTTPFANISNLSSFDDEKEVLFSMHSTFRVLSVELRDEDIWYIDLEFVDNLWDTDFDERSIFGPHADQIFIRHLSKENKQFIAFQLLMDMILRLDQTSYAKDELLEFCRLKYQNDQVELRKIDDYEQNYQSKDAAEWFTKDSFLYRLLNQSLRIETIDQIIKMRFYIHDLHNQLAKLQSSVIQSSNGQTNLTLYRGQTMKINQLNELRENNDGFISMNSFLSATRNEKVAFAFSGDGVTTEPDEVSVIYEMLIDTNIRSTPYAEINSVNTDEEEILFSMGAVFRIGDVDKVSDHDGVFRVKLTMVHIEDQLWNKLTAHLD